MSKHKVLIGIPTCEVARLASFYDHIDLMHKPEGTVIARSHGQSPARNRNLIIDQALKINCTHVLFIDDDVVPRPNMLEVLLDHDKDIVCALQLMRNYPHFPLIFKKADENGRCVHHFLSNNESGLVEIVAAGLGCCLINADVFRAMEQPWIRLGELDKEGWSDDLGFFRRVRELGYKVFCDLDLPCGHQASVTIWPNRINDKWLTTYDTAGTDVVSVSQITLAAAIERDRLLVNA